MKKLSGVKEIFSILIRLLVSQVYTCVILCKSYTYDLFITLYVTFLSVTKEKKLRDKLEQRFSYLFV